MTPAIRAARVKFAKAAKSPKFQRVVAQIQQGARRVATHPPATRKAAEAQAAAKGPPNEKEAGARANQIDDIKDAKTEKPNKGGFLVLLRGEIEKIMPRTNDDATKFMQGGEGEQVKASVGSNVKQQKEKAVGPTETATKAPPNTGNVEAKEVTPAPADPAAQAPGVAGAQGMPDPRPESGVQKVAQDASASADKQMKDADLTDEQLTKANDPRFSSVLTARDKVKATATAGAAKYKSGEAKTLAQAQAGATGVSGQGAYGLAGSRNATNAKTKTAQQIAKEKDEAELRAFTSDITGIFDGTKAKVEQKLATLEADAMALFDRGIDTALARMKSSCEAEISRFKWKRYGGLGGPALWLIDQFRDTLPEIKEIIARSRERFTGEMDQVAVNVANVVDRRLADAKSIVDAGQAQVKARAARLSPNLRAKGAEAAEALTSKFDELRQSIDDKAQDLAEKLAQKYKDASEKADSLAKEIDDANKGALKALGDKIAEIVKMLAEFADRVVSLFKKAAGVIKKIVGDPIGFLGNLLSAIKQGISQFVSNIWGHIKKGFMTWLFGELTKAGVEIPSDLSLPSILKLVLGVLGLTWAQIRPRVVKKIGEKAVVVLEKVVEILTKLFTSGPAALWEEMKAFVGDLKGMVIDAIMDWVITKVITSAITKVASMFNPAGAIIQAIIMVYNVGSWLVANIGKILDFIESVVNSVDRIADGDVGGAASFIEQALARMIPILIGFLASLLGLGGLAAKVKSFITKVQNTVGKAVDWVIDKTFNLVKKAVGFVKGLFGKGDKKKDGKDDKKKGDEEGEDEKITESVSMHGVAHTIEVDPARGEVTLASAKGPADPKLGSAEAKVQALDDEDMKKRALKYLAKMRAKIQTIQGFLSRGKAGFRPHMREASRNVQGFRDALGQYGNEFKIEDVNQPLQGFGPPVVKEYPAPKKKEPDGSSREGHHVPAKELAKTLKDAYGKEARSIKGKYGELGKAAAAALVARAKSMDVNASGTGLLAISLHRVTHQNAGGAAVHAAAAADDIAAEVARIDADEKRTTLLVTTDAGNLAVNPGKKTWASWLGDIRKQLGDSGSTTRALSQTAAGATKATEANKKLASTRSLAVMSRIANSAFDNAFSQGVAAVRNALQSSLFDGSTEKRASALGELTREKARGTWTSRGVLDK